MHTNTRWTRVASDVVYTHTGGRDMRGCTVHEREAVIPNPTIQSVIASGWDVRLDGGRGEVTQTKNKIEHDYRGVDEFRLKISSLE